MLDKIARLGHDKARFAKMYGHMFDYYKGVVYEALPGHRLPQKHSGVKPH